MDYLYHLGAHSLIASFERRWHSEFLRFGLLNGSSKKGTGEMASVWFSPGRTPSARVAYTHPLPQSRIPALFIYLFIFFPALFKCNLLLIAVT